MSEHIPHQYRTADLDDVVQKLDDISCHLSTLAENTQNVAEMVDLLNTSVKALTEKLGGK